MASQELLNKDCVVEGNSVTITETVKKVMSKQELMQEINNYQMQQQNIINQMNGLKTQYNLIKQAKEQVEEILTSFPVDDLPTI